MYYIYVNGNRVHDEGEHDADGNVTRLGGQPLGFATQSEADAMADALFERASASPFFKPNRESYVVAEPPSVR